MWCPPWTAGGREERGMEEEEGGRKRECGWREGRDKHRHGVYHKEIGEW